MVLFNGISIKLLAGGKACFLKRKTRSVWSQTPYWTHKTKNWGEWDNEVEIYLARITPTLKLF